MDQLGHTDPKLTLRLYTHMMRRRDGERERLRALVEGAEMPGLGASADSPTGEQPDQQVPENGKTPAVAGDSRESG
jgi:hypothetical protein